MTGGYLSEAAKRSFSVRVGVLGVVFFLLQTFVPMAFMAVMFITVFSFERIPRFQSGISYALDDDLLVVRELGSVASAACTYELVRINPEREHVELQLETSPRLAKDRAGRIWCVTPAFTWWREQGVWTAQTNEPVLRHLQWVTATASGIVAVTETPDDQKRYWQLDGQRWQPCSEPAATVRGFRLAGTNYRFRRKDDTLYFCDGATGAWHSVADIADLDDYTPFTMGTTTWVYARAGRSGAKTQGSMWRLEGGAWQRVSVTNVSAASCYDTVLHRSNAVYFAATSWDDGLAWHRFDGTAMQAAGRSGPRFFLPLMLAPMGAVYLMPLVMPLLFALILSMMMPRYRVCEYVTEAGSARFASLIRRACAEIIDALIFALPMLAAVLVMFISGVMAQVTSGDGNPLGMLVVIMGALGGMMLYGIATLAIYAILEGRYGATPGKWLLGIRVLDEERLRPCGFWRALVRNLLRFVDGFFYYLVGLLLAAFTERWQRVGDMVARTVVVRTRGAELPRD